MAYSRNSNRFPFNIFKPDTVEVNGDEYTRYRAKFNSLHDLYTYLSSDPKINKEVFRELASLENDRDFAGVPYEEALEELNKPPRSEYVDFLKLSDSLNEDAMGYVQEYTTVKSPGGGYVDIPSYVTGNPLCYRISRSIYTPKFIKVHVVLSYYWGTTKKQVFNRALIIAALINAFEQAGYIVDVNTFELSEKSDEMVQIDVNIKNSDETFNKASLYKSLCYVEFLRRLLFRVLETLDVQRNWSSGYGQTCDEDTVRSVRKLGENDIFFDQPDKMGIEGKNIEKDFETVIRKLHIEDKIDVENAKKEFSKSVRVLKKTIR